MNSVQEQADAVIRSVIPENTNKAYSSDMRYFEGWIKAFFGKHIWPVDEEIILQFILHHLSELPEDLDIHLVRRHIKSHTGKHSISTVKRRLVSIGLRHVADGFPDPCKSEKVRDLMTAFQKNTDATAKKRAITKDVLRDLVNTCGDTLADCRDQAILLFAFCSGGRRRSEISEAKIDNIEMQEDGSYIYTIPRGKTDQIGKGLQVPINGPAARALAMWFKRSKVREGYIFRGMSRSGVMQGQLPIDEISCIVKKRAEMAGYDPQEFSSHSLRRGFVTEAGKQGVPFGDIMAMTGHKSVRICMGYYEAGAVGTNKAANLL